MEELMSIATKRGDGGETSLVGNVRVSKGSERIEACGTVDELNSAIGFARSICDDAEVREMAKAIQRELFAVASALAGAAGAFDPAAADRLTTEVHRLEKVDGVIADWSIPGEHPGAAAFDVARAICRRAERCVVRLGDEETIPYLNRLSDLLWLMARVLE